MVAGIERKLGHGLLLVVILVGWTLALVRLADRSLWADEGYTAYLAQQAEATDLVTSLRRDHSPLHLLLVAGMVRLSRSEMAIRFPSAVASVLALPVLYMLGSRLFRRRTAGLLGAFLLAISPFAVYYAQEARTYALFMLLSSLSLLLLLMALDMRRWYWWAGYAVSTALVLYTHYFAWFVVGTGAIFASTVLLRESWMHRQIDRRLLALAASLLFVGLAYIPWLPSLLSYWQRQGPGTKTLAPGLETYEFSVAFFRRMIIHFGARDGPYGYYLAIGCLLLGLGSIVIHKKWRCLWLMVLSFALPVAFLTLLPSKHFFDYRYLIFLLPLFLLAMAEGLAATVSLATKIGELARLRPYQPILASGLAVLLIVPANRTALQSYQATEKENWRGISDFLEKHLLPDEALFVAPKYWAYPLRFYEPSLEQYLVGGDQLAQLEGKDDQYAGLWFIRFAAPLADPSGEFTHWLTERQFELLVDGQACGSGLHVFYRRFDEQSQARQAQLFQFAAEFCPTDPRFSSPPS